jgi:Nuclease-related domain
VPSGPVVASGAFALDAGLWVLVAVQNACRRLGQPGTRSAALIHRARTRQASRAHGRYGIVLDSLYPYVCGAGRSVRRKHAGASKRWRTRVFRRPHLITAALVAAIMIVVVVARGDRWLTLVAASFGLLLGAYLVLRESPPEYIENWRTGAEGERKTARVLAPLRREGFELLHDLPDRHTAKSPNAKGNLDHVVVSNAGVFVLDSKLLGGEASIRGDTVRVQRRDDDEDSYDLWWLARSMRARARRLCDDIMQETGVKSVGAVVVFWNDFPARLVEREDLVFVHGDRLVSG